MIYTGTYWPLHMTTTVPQTVSQCTLCMLYNSEIPSSTHSDTLTHFNKTSFFLFDPNCYLSSHPIHSTLSVHLFHPSFHAAVLAMSPNKPWFYTTPSPPTCLLSFCVLNSAHTLQLSCLCGISSGWIVYFCMRPNANVPISVTLWKL